MRSASGIIIAFDDGSSKRLQGDDPHTRDRRVSDFGFGESSAALKMLVNGFVTATQPERLQVKSLHVIEVF